MFNEPSDGTWGASAKVAYNSNTDWPEAAVRIGEHVTSYCPRWLVVVTGIGNKDKRCIAWQKKGISCW